MVNTVVQQAAAKLKRLSLTRILLVQKRDLLRPSSEHPRFYSRFPDLFVKREAVVPFPPGVISRLTTTLITI
jgi:hypothetical protein